MLEVKLFGTGEVSHLNKKISIPLHQLPGQLFCYLLLNRTNPQGRERLAETFWADRTTTESRKYLRKALWQLQRTLSELIDPGTEQVLTVETDWLQVNPQANLWVDIAVFERGYQTVMNLRGRELNSDQYDDTRKAVELYQGDLLEGWYQDWCLLERERFKEMYLNLVDKLMGYCEANNQYEAGICYGRKILKHDRTHERTYLRMMRLFYLAGDRVSAIRQYVCCQNALREELDVEPSLELQELHKALIRDTMERARSHISYKDEKDPVRVSEIHQSLKRVLEMLSKQEGISLQIQKEIKNIEAVIERH
jgi:DNA-binding SARP family transcriptional activator